MRNPSLGPAEPGSSHVMRSIIGKPVGFPCSEQDTARGSDLGILQHKIAGRFFEHHFAHIGGVDRHPSEFRENKLGAAMLRFGDDLILGPEALVAELRRRHPDAVDVAGRNARGACETDEQGVEVGAFAAEMAALQHRSDISDTAAARLGIAICVRYDPTRRSPAPFRCRLERRMSPCRRSLSQCHRSG
jgi:hypothetical protein